MLLTPFFTLLSAASCALAIRIRDLPAGCNCTIADPGCQFGPISDPAKGTISFLAPNGTDVSESHSAEPGYTVSLYPSRLEISLTLTLA